MEVALKNIGILENASVKVDGLTVIAGLNDSGKSTIGKVLFSLIKAVKNYESDIFENKNESLFQLYDKLYFLVRRGANFEKNVRLRDDFIPPQFQEDFRNNPTPEFLQSKLEFLKKQDEFSSESIKEMEKVLAEIRELYFRNKTKDEKLKMALDKSLYSEFQGDICCKTFKSSEISLFEGSNELIHIYLNGETKIKIVDQFIPFKDATLVESPVLLSLLDIIQNLQVSFDLKPDVFHGPFYRRGATHYHIKDLITKMDLNSDGKNSDEFIDKIFNIIGANISFKRGNVFSKTKELLFEKVLESKTHTIKNVNTAMGIKSFAILNILYRGGYLNEDCLLILDEPEVHLHPKWQVEYAKLIVELVSKKKAKILITSHSPYLITALEKYSKQEKIFDKSNFYFTQKQKNGLCTVIDKKETLEEVYSQLSEPFEKLVFD